MKGKNTKSGTARSKKKQKEVRIKALLHTWWSFLSNVMLLGRMSSNKMLQLLGSYIKYKSKYIQCKFDLRLLMNHPMVSVPKAWVIDKQESFE